MIKPPHILLFTLLLSLTPNCTSTPHNAKETPTEQPPSKDASTSENTPKEGSTCPPGVPAPSDPCLAGCGNEIRVGQPCTRGGGECSENKKAFFCTGDFNKTTHLLYCTRPCVIDDDCGSSMKCTGDPKDPKSPRGCIPQKCIHDDKNETPTKETTTETSPKDAGTSE